MDLQLAGKTALITGASKGIGRAAAERLAAEGAHVVLVSRTAADLAATKAAIAQQSKVQIDTVAADLSHSSAIDQLARDFPMMVNNAGAIPDGSLLDVDEQFWRKAWDLKVFGYINMRRAYYALMKDRGSGLIINVTGNAAQTHDPEYICGVAGNAALTAFSQSLGSISVRHGIRVISLNPGPVETERLVNLMKKKALDRTGNADNWRELFKPLPFGRGCAPDEVGTMIAFLASERCSYNSGSVMTIDAGLSARTFNF
jgi:3-oxoacyl-[acyl-carrier protein] reductase